MSVWLHSIFQLRWKIPCRTESIYLLTGIGMSLLRVFASCPYSKFSLCFAYYSHLWSQMDEDSLGRDDADSY